MNNIEKYEKKPYLYDLYRWTGKVDLKIFLKWRFRPKYKIVYLLRKCQLNRKKNKLSFLWYRLWYEHYMTVYGVDIGAKAEIGPGFIIRHLGGIAINSGAKIGKDVEILQGVTIGFERRGKRMGNPTIGDRVWIGSHAAIVGNVKIGNDVLIAPGAYVNFDVPDNSIVLGNPGKIIKKDNAVEEYVINILDIEKKDIFNNKHCH